MDFHKWLNKTIKHYQNLSKEDQITTLQTLINTSPPSQLFYLHRDLSFLLKRDFIGRLPEELSHHLLFYLDAKTSLIGCQVSRTWRETISGCQTRWKSLCYSYGIVEPSSVIPNYKKHLLKGNQILHNLHTHKALSHTILRGHKQRINCVAYHAGQIVTGADDRTVRVWARQDGSWMNTMEIRTHTVAAIKFDYDLIFTGSFDCTAAAWSMETGQLRRTYIGHVGAVLCLDYNTHLDVLVTGSADQTVKIWGLRTTECFKTLHMERVGLDVKRTLYLVPRKNKKGENGESMDFVQFGIVAYIDGIQEWCVKVDDINGTYEVMSHQVHEDYDGSPLPGLQIKHDKLTYAGVSHVGHDIVFTVNERELYDAGNVNHSESKELVKQSHSHNLKRRGRDSYVYVGEGRHFRVYICEEAEYNFTGRLDFVRKADETCVASYPMRDVRCRFHGGDIALCDAQWMDGLNCVNDRGVVAVFVSGIDNALVVVEWVKMIK